MQSDPSKIAEPYEVWSSDGRRFIVRATGEDAARQNALVPGDKITITSAKPVVSYGETLTAEQLSRALGGSPSAETLLKWAMQRKIPHFRRGRKHIRFDRERVLASMAEEGRA